MKLLKLKNYSILHVRLEQINLSVLILAILSFSLMFVIGYSILNCLFFYSAAQKNVPEIQIFENCYVLNERT